MAQGLIALTRPVSASLAACELTHVARAPIDVARAQEQHAEYCATLALLGCEVVELPALPECPDAVFVEDTVVVVDEVAVLTRPGAASRRGEVDSMAEAIAPYRAVQRIAAPGSIDGGDVLRIGSTLYVGASSRSNAEGVAQLRGLLAPLGYNVVSVPLRDCLHLKSAVTLVADDTVLLQPAWVDADAFSHLRRIEVDPSEEHAANALRMGAHVVLPACFPRTRARLDAAGLATVAVDVSELQKAEGAVTCCSVVFSAASRTGG